MVASALVADCFGVYIHHRRGATKVRTGAAQSVGGLFDVCCRGWVPANVSDVMALIKAESVLLGVAPGICIGALLGKGTTCRTDTSGV